MNELDGEDHDFLDGEHRGQALLHGRGDRGGDEVPGRRPPEERPPGLTLLTALEVIPGPRLHELATCLGLWNTDGLGKPALVRLMQRAPLVNVDAVWSEMSVLERGLARRALAARPPEPEARPATSMVRTLFDVLDVRLLAGRMGLGGSPGLAGMVQGTTRRLLSLLMLLPMARVAEVARMLDLAPADALSVATQAERKRVPSRRLLGLLTDKELRTAAAVWAVTAPREELIEGLSRSMDTEGTPQEATPRSTAS